MPDFVQIASVVPDLESVPVHLRAAIEDDYPEPGDDLLTWRDLEKRLVRIGKSAPDLAMRVVFDGGLRWFDLQAMGVRNGEVWHATFTLSLAEARNERCKADFAPELTIALDVPGDRLVDLVNGLATEYEECSAERRTLRVPFRYEAPLDALAFVAAHLARESETFVVEHEEALYLAELRRGKDVTLRALYVWHDDPELRAAGRAASTAPRPGVFTKAATRAPEIASWDPKRPLVTGSAQRREQAALEMMPMFTKHDSGWGINPFEKPTSPELMATLVAAARAEENRGPAFESVRKTLYGYVGDFKAIEAGRALIAMLDQETEPEMRLALYELIAKRRGKNPGRVLVKAYREEHSVRGRLGEMLWKHEAAIEMLVRDQLVPSWRSDRDYATAIVKLLKRELIPVPPSWLEGADAELVSALGDLVRTPVDVSPSSGSLSV